MTIRKQLVKKYINKNSLFVSHWSRETPRLFIFLIITLIVNSTINNNCGGKNIWQDAINNFEYLYEMGEFVESKKAAEYALELARETKKNTETRLVESYINLGKADISIQNLESGEKSLSKALEIVNNNLGENRRLNAVCNIHIGHLYSLKGDIPIGMEYLNTARQYFLDNNELQSDNYAKLIEIIAQIHFSIGDYNGSEKHYRKSLSIREKFILDKQNSLAQCSNNLAAVLRIKGELKESEHYTKNALEIWERIFSGEHENIGIGLNNLGVIYKHQGRYEEAEATLSKALLINEKYLGENHIELAPDYNNMAQLMHTKGNYAPAEIYYQKAINILMQDKEGYRFEIGQIFANMGELHFSTGNYKKALNCFSDAINQISSSNVEQKSAILKSMDKRRKQIEEILSYNFDKE
jgi:tetratricopeptide (TPR) repeat protein